MKKIICFLLFLCLILVGCANKEEPAEILLLNESQEEITYQFTKTKNTEEVKDIFRNLTTAKTTMDFNGVSLDAKVDLSGKIFVVNQETRTIDLKYSADLQAKANLKKYLMDAEVVIEGNTKTESNSLSLNVKQKGSVQVKNDDDYIYLNGSLDDAGNKISIKNKINIQDFTKQYKNKIISFLDVLKYYNPLEFLPNLQNMIDLYYVQIVETKKDSFTIHMQIPAVDIYSKLASNTILQVDMEIDCSTLLPIHIQCDADQVIEILLENEYVKQYLSSMVQVENANLNLEVFIQYAYIDVKELTESEKTSYEEYFKTK